MAAKSITTQGSNNWQWAIHGLKIGVIMLGIITTGAEVNSSAH